MAGIEFQSPVEIVDRFPKVTMLVMQTPPLKIVIGHIRLFLDQYSYLGINSRLDRYRPLDLNGSSALPFTRLGGESEQDIS